MHNTTVSVALFGPDMGERVFFADRSEDLESYSS